jgi:hypothetical protein
MGPEPALVKEAGLVLNLKLLEVLEVSHSMGRKIHLLKICVFCAIGS